MAKTKPHLNEYKEDLLKVFFKEFVVISYLLYLRDGLFNEFYEYE